MTLQYPGAVRVAVSKSTSGVGGARTIPTGVRFYSPQSMSTGSGLPNAVRAVKNSQTTVLTRAAMATSLALTLGGGAYLYRDKLL